MTARPAPFTPPFTIYVGGMRYGEEQRDLADAHLMAQHLLHRKGIESVVVDRNGSVCGQTQVARCTAFSVALSCGVCEVCHDSAMAARNERLRELAALDPWPSGVDTQPFEDAS